MKKIVVKNEELKACPECGGELVFQKCENQQWNEGEAGACRQSFSWLHVCFNNKS
jgi:hypothetical protein